MRRGLHHIGLQVEELGEARARYQKFNPRGVVVTEPGGLHHGAIRIFDPECNPVTLSEGSFGVEQGSGFPRIAHVAFNALDPEVMLNFYVQVLGAPGSGEQLQAAAQRPSPTASRATAPPTSPSTRSSTPTRATSAASA